MNYLIDQAMNRIPPDEAWRPQANGDNLLNRLVRATVRAAAHAREEDSDSASSLSPGVAWLVRDALEGPQAVGGGSVLGLSTMVSELS